MNPIEIKRITLLVLFTSLFNCAQLALSASYVYDENSVERSIKTEKNGFTWVLIHEPQKSNYECQHKYTALSISGDTLLTSDDNITYAYVEHPEHEIYGGFFVTGYPYKSLYDMFGRKLIGEEKKINHYFLEMTTDSIPYFEVRKSGKKIESEKYGIYDINGIEVLPIKYKVFDRKNRVSIKDNVSGFYKDKDGSFIGKRLPTNIDYQEYRDKINNYIKASSYLNLPIVEEKKVEKDGFVWVLLSQGEYTGAKDNYGNIIIPLTKKYKNLKYLPLSQKYKLSCFSFEENSYEGICDLHGNVIIPSNRNYNWIRFDEGYGNDGAEIVGFFHAYSGYLNYVEICDIAGNIIIPKEREYKMVKFWAEKNHIGYFEVIDKCGSDYKSGICDMSGEEIISLRYEWISYNEDKGFSCSGMKEYTGIRLDKNGIADYTLKRQWYKEKEKAKLEKKKARAKFWANFGQALLQSAANGFNSYTQYQMRANQMVSPNSTTGSIASQMETPGYFNNAYQQIMGLSIAQVQYQEMADYNKTRQAYLSMGKDLSYQEYCLLKGQAIENLKEQGYDIIAEQKKINEDLHDLNRGMMNSGKENVERIKQQNDLKSGKSTNSGTSNTISSNKSTKSSSTSTTTKTTSRSSSSTSYGSTDGGTSSNGTTSNNDTHKQFKTGNINTDSSSYGDKIKNVSMSVKDGATFRGVNLHGELYKKDGQFYVKIGNSFFKVFSTGGTYNGYIIYGEKAHYFNK